MQISTVINDAILELKNGGTNTTSGTTDHDYEEGLKSIFDSINSDGNIFAS